MMDSLEKLSKQIAVRIAGNGGKDLIGSGAIMPCEPYKYALIFTAAHVLEDAEKYNMVHFCFADGNNEEQKLELTLIDGKSRDECPEGNIGFVYEHPEYVRRGKEPYQIDVDEFPRNDAAVIIIPFCEWMKTIPTFNICKYDDGEVILVGFPAVDDKVVKAESDARYISHRGNIYAESVKVEDLHKANLVVKGVQKDVINRLKGNNRAIDGLSGGGLFSYGQHGLLYHGAFASTKNKGQDNYYATAALVFLEIMDKYRIKARANRDFSFYSLKAAERFDSIVDAEANAWFRRHVNLYAEKYGRDYLFKDTILRPEYLSCESYRPLCPIYYIEKLVGFVLLDFVYEMEGENAGKLSIYIGDSEHPVRLEYICSESKKEMIISEIVTKGAFSEKGPFINGSVFVVSDKHAEKPNFIMSRKRCRRIIESIVYEDDARSEDFSRRVKNLLREEHREDEYVTHSIIKGDLVQADVGFVGIGNFEEIMRETECREDKLVSDVKELMEKVWRA